MQASVLPYHLCHRPPWQEFVTSIYIDLTTIITVADHCVQITEPARFQCFTSRGTHKCGSPIEMDADHCWGSLSNRMLSKGL
jgi:hypothetical protein